MAKVIFSTPVSNTDNAGFQAWTTEMFNAFVSAGLVQTADTGQMAVPVVVPRPSGAGFAGYWIFRFNDTLQATAPIFIKIEPGRGGTTNSFRCRATIGTGSDGAGNITGSMGGIYFLVETSSSSANPLPTYINHDEGFFGVIYKVGLTSNGLGFLAICRTTDDAGVPTGAGVFAVGKAGSTITQAICGTFGAFSAVATDSSYCCPAFPSSSSAIGSDYQAYKVYGVYPNTRIVPQLVAVLKSELPVGNTTGPVEIMDGVFRNYIAGGDASGGMTISAASSYQLCMKWD